MFAEVRTNLLTVNERTVGQQMLLLVSGHWLDGEGQECSVDRRRHLPSLRDAAEHENVKLKKSPQNRRSYSAALDRV